MAIGVAIVGAGIFARTEHLPAVIAAETLELKAIYSRSLKSAKSLSTDVDLYSEDSGEGKGLDDLLSRSDIQAVVVALPIPKQPDIIRKALLAGKHVLSEKPVAPDVAAAKQLIAWYHGNIDTKKTWWGVAENFRYMNSYDYAAEKIKELGGVKSFAVEVKLDTKPGDQYFETEWRKTPSHQGGFVLDAGVHFMAAIRLLLGPNDQVTSITSTSELKRSYLAPVDTVSSKLKTKSGAEGTFYLTFAAEERSRPTYKFTCEKGEVTVSFSDVTVNGETQDLKDERTGVPPEVRKWGEALARGEQNARQTPEEALADLELLQAILESGDKKGEAVAVKLQL